MTSLGEKEAAAKKEESLVKITLSHTLEKYFVISVKWGTHLGNFLPDNDTLHSEDSPPPHLQVWQKLYPTPSWLTRQVKVLSVDAESRARAGEETTSGGDRFLTDGDWFA